VTRSADVGIIIGYGKFTLDPERDLAAEKEPLDESRLILRRSHMSSTESATDGGTLRSLLSHFIFFHSILYPNKTKGDQSFFLCSHLIAAYFIQFITK
jgi:hypothetical protein